MTAVSPANVSPSRAISLDSAPDVELDSVLDRALAAYLLRREQQPDLMPGVFAEELPAQLRSAFLSEIEGLGEIDRLADAPPRDLPQRIGNYRVLGRLGDGATGTVYEGEQISLGRCVALKVLHEHLAHHEATRQRFAREARLASSLLHPAIVQIHDFVEADGRAMLVMERAPGRSLRLLLHARQHVEHTDHADAVRLLEDPQRIATTFAEMADAIAFAHARGVVHRDLKPANLLISDDGHPTVLDFGLARAIDDADIGLTRTGDLIGTPLYMAPEQLSGARTGPHSDIWALGCVLLECLTGRPPAGPFSVDARDLPLRLALIIERCLDRDPARRYESAADLAVDLRRFAKGYSHCCSWRWTRRVRRQAQLVLAMLVIGIGSMCWWLLLAGGAEEPSAAADQAAPTEIAERLARVEQELLRLAKSRK